MPTSTIKAYDLFRLVKVLSYLLSNTGSLLAERRHGYGNLVYLGAHAHSALAGLQTLGLRPPEHVAEHAASCPRTVRCHSLNEASGAVLERRAEVSAFRLRILADDQSHASRNFGRGEGRDVVLRQAAYVLLPVRFRHRRCRLANGYCGVGVVKHRVSRIQPISCSL